MRLFKIGVAIILGVALSGCSPNNTIATRSAAVCSDASDECVLALVEKELVTIADDAVWINAAVEYSYALLAAEKERDAERILDAALQKTTEIDNINERTKAYYEIAVVMVDSGRYRSALNVISDGDAEAARITTAQSKADYLARFAALRIGAGDTRGGRSMLKKLSRDTDNQASFKARAHKEAAIFLAKKSRFKEAVELITLVDYGLTYYRSTARTKLAALMNEAGLKADATRVLQQAEDIARAQADGYFRAGAIRQAAEFFCRAGDSSAAYDRALVLFSEAGLATQDARTPQHQARALSRIATTLADCGLYEQAVLLFPEILGIAVSEPSEQMRAYAYYEIVGSAAFAGDFDLAIRELDNVPDIKFGSAQSLRNAALRDIGWGLTRHGKIDDAVTLSNTIDTSREKIQLLSRIVRLRHDPDMPAFPRYL